MAGVQFPVSEIELFDLRKRTKSKRGRVVQGARLKFEYLRMRGFEPHRLQRAEGPAQKRLPTAIHPNSFSNLQEDSKIRTLQKSGKVGEFRLLTLFGS